MYKAPIEILSTKKAEYKLDTEKMVMEAVFKTGINVDKDELIRALQYDREQYDKGFADGKEEAAREIFEEIEYLIWQHDTHPAGELTVKIDELKKKYTEGDT